MWNPFFKTKRPWGYYRVLLSGRGFKVKELVVFPGKKMSFQRHKLRSELWFVAEGVITRVDEHHHCIIYKHEDVLVSPGQWHQICNNSDKKARIIEIQYGTLCSEKDIERAEAPIFTHEPFELRSFRRKFKH